MDDPVGARTQLTDRIDVEDGCLVGAGGSYLVPD